MTRDIHPQFQNTFNYFSSIPDNIQVSLWNYMAYGFTPGSFLEAVLLNDFYTAIARSDGTWTIRGLKDLAKWIDYHIPYELRGTQESMKKWADKTNEERRDIMIELELRPNEFDILRGAAVS